ncbi:hypothetical protein ACE1CD_28930 [Aerosakkonema sp. BLCC-F183]|uniref:hypothetical protein n=1 Tax=Aerosakkonema sp. BLCC-F183 TaxID=3342834 RepID=UPI0035B82248
MVMRPLTRRFGVLDGELQSRLGELSVEVWEDLHAVTYNPSSAHSNPMLRGTKKISSRLRCLEETQK